MIVGTLLLSLVERLAFGQHWLLEVSGEMLQRAGRSLMGAGGASLTIGKGDGVEALLGLPSMAARDFVAALSALASPLFVGGLIFSAACFMLLLRWRQQGAARGD